MRNGQAMCVRSPSKPDQAYVENLTEGFILHICFEAESCPEQETISETVTASTHGKKKKKAQQ